MSLKVWSNGHIGAFLHCHDKPSANIKTGDMAQLAILAIRYLPTDLLKKGMDYLICGLCALKGGKGCYVNPVVYNSIWRHAKKGKMPKLNKPIRLGSYGDPGLLPLKVLKQAIDKAKGRWTGYTHQWSDIDPSYAQYLMASIDGIDGKTRQQAKAKGYRTFRILGPDDNLEQGEILCPNFTHDVQCRDCLLCSGTEGRGKTDIAIPVHGAPNKIKLWN
tara:strand:- start:742 stop:1395 length:654 start_codon:yes stop_codon:yes gene_type:complete